MSGCNKEVSRQEALVLPDQSPLVFVFTFLQRIFKNIEKTEKMNQWKK